MNKNTNYSLRSNQFFFVSNSAFLLLGWTVASFQLMKKEWGYFQFNRHYLKSIFGQLTLSRLPHNFMQRTRGGSKNSLIGSNILQTPSTLFSFLASPFLIFGITSLLKNSNTWNLGKIFYGTRLFKYSPNVPLRCHVRGLKFSI